MPVHRIHLKGPWEYEWLGPFWEDLPFEKRGRLRMPVSWESAFGRTVGMVRFSRRFHQPTNLDPHERVLLVFDGIGGQGTVRLNDNALGAVEASAGRLEFDVTENLRPSCELTVELEFDPAGQGKTPGGLWGPVAIEIRS